MELCIKSYHAYTAGPIQDVMVRYRKMYITVIARTGQQNVVRQESKVCDTAIFPGINPFASSVAINHMFILHAVNPNFCEVHTYSHTMRVSGVPWSLLSTSCTSGFDSTVMW